MATTKSPRMFRAAAILALALGGCGGGGSSTPTVIPTPTPVPCTRTTLFSNSGAVPARTLVFNEFAVSSNGRLDMTLDWTFAASQMGLYLVPASTCSGDEFNARTCNFLVRSEPPG